MKKCDNCGKKMSKVRDVCEDCVDDVMDGKNLIDGNGKPIKTWCQ